MPAYPKYIQSFHRLSLLLLAAGVIVHAYTYLPGVPALSTVWLFVLFAGIFITFIPAIQCAKAMVGGEFRPDMWKIALAPLTVWHRRGLLMLLVYVAFNFIFTLFHLTGGLSAEVVDGQYQLLNKGRVVRTVDATTYHQHRNREMRGMTGHVILFQTISGALLLSALRRRDDQTQP